MLAKEDDINKTSSTINIIAVLIGIISLIIFYFLRRDLLPVISLFEYIRLFFFISIIFILPDFIQSSVRDNKKWYYSIEFNTILVLSVFCITGLILNKHIYYPSYLIIPTAFFLG